MDNTKVTMTIKEIKRVEVMTLLETGKITGSQAAKMMGLSLRQTRRIIKKYLEGGAANLLTFIAFPLFGCNPGATPMIPGGHNGLCGKFCAYFVYCMDTMDAVIRCGQLEYLTSNQQVIEKF